MALLAAPPHPSVTFPRLLLTSVDGRRGPCFAGWVGDDGAGGEDLWLRLERCDDSIDIDAENAENGNDGARPLLRAQPSSLRSFRLVLSAPLQRALRGHEDAVAARLRQSRDAAEFFSELRTLLEAVGVASGSGRKKKKRGRTQGDERARRSPSSLLSSSFYSALLERLGPKSWKSMTAMREAGAAAESNDGNGEVLLSFAVSSDGDERASTSSSSPPPPPPLRVTLAVDPATFPRSAPRVASVDLPPALLRPPLALPIPSWWNKNHGSESDGNPSNSNSNSKSKSNLDEVLSWLLAAASSRAASAAFSALDQLDSAAWVLDPPLPAPRARASRRVAAAEGGRVSVEVDFSNFFNSSASSSSAAALQQLSFLPAPRFSGWLGPEALVSPLREAAEESAKGRAWDPSRTAVENLEALLKMGKGLLPKRPGGGGGRNATATTTTTTASKEKGKEEEEPVGLGDGAECAICCAYRLEEEDDKDGGGGEHGGGGEGAAAKNPASSSSSSFALPSVSCENGRCGRPFHASCLREWLIAAAGGGGGGREGGGGVGGAGDGGGGGVLRGECPYCSELISVSKK